MKKYLKLILSSALIPLTFSSGLADYTSNNSINSKNITAKKIPFPVFIEANINKQNQDPYALTSEEMVASEAKTRSLFYPDEDENVIEEAIKRNLIQAKEEKARSIVFLPPNFLYTFKKNISIYLSKDKQLINHINDAQHFIWSSLFEIIDLNLNAKSSDQFLFIKNEISKLISEVNFSEEEKDLFKQIIFGFDTLIINNPYYINQGMFSPPRLLTIKELHTKYESDPLKNESLLKILANNEIYNSILNEANLPFQNKIKDIIKTNLNFFRNQDFYDFFKGDRTSIKRRFLKWYPTSSPINSMQIYQKMLNSLNIKTDKIKISIVEPLFLNPGIIQNFGEFVKYINNMSWNDSLKTIDILNNFSDYMDKNIKNLDGSNGNKKTYRGMVLSPEEKNYVMKNGIKSLGFINDNTLNNALLLLCAEYVYNIDLRPEDKWKNKLSYLYGQGETRLVPSNPGYNFSVFTSITEQERVAKHVGLAFGKNPGKSIDLNKKLYIFPLNIPYIDKIKPQGDGYLGNAIQSFPSLISVVPSLEGKIVVGKKDHAYKIDEEGVEYFIIGGISPSQILEPKKYEENINDFQAKYDLPKNIYYD